MGMLPGASVLLPTKDQIRAASRSDSGHRGTKDPI